MEATTVAQRVSVAVIAVAAAVCPRGLRRQFSGRYSTACDPLRSRGRREAADVQAEVGCVEVREPAHTGSVQVCGDAVLDGDGDERTGSDARSHGEVRGGRVPPPRRARTRRVDYGVALANLVTAGDAAQGGGALSELGAMGPLENAFTALNELQAELTQTIRVGEAVSDRERVLADLEAALRVAMAAGVSAADVFVVVTRVNADVAAKKSASP